MATIQVRDLDTEVVEQYRHRAKREGKSLQQYMKELLTKEAPRSTNRRVFAELEHSGLLKQSTTTVEQIVDDVRTLREAA